jgi:hypothetical protein
MPGYFEKQVNLHCALHSLNNLVQCKLFSFEELTNHAIRLHRTATDNLINSNSIPRQLAATYYNENGDFSQEVIEEALIGKGFDFEIVSIEAFNELLSSNDPLMLIITRLNHHYSARRFETGGPLWVFDSLFENPVKDSQLINEKLLYFLKENFNMRTIVTRVFTMQNTIQYMKLRLLKR